MIIYDNNICGVIFDLDGILVFFEFDFLLIKVQVGCFVEKDLFVYIVFLFLFYMCEEVMNIVYQYELLDVQYLYLFFGVVDVIIWLKENNILMVIVI